MEAAEEVKGMLASQSSWQEELSKGKMFGVLVVQDGDNIGFLAAYSGILDGRNGHPYFVPPVYDLLRPEGFFKTGEKTVTELNHRIDALEKDAMRTELRKIQDEMQARRDCELSDFRHRMDEAKRRRDEIRNHTSDTDIQTELIRESQYLKAEYKRMVRKWDAEIKDITDKLYQYTLRANALKEERKLRSAALQRQIFNRFRMRNARGETRNLCDIFTDYGRELPPAGSGECAAPKLLQFAYSQGLHPVAMGEFWWGASPKTELRRHGSFYPACRSKCEPILSFMLEGLDVEPNPLNAPITHHAPKVVYEDEWMVAVNKPAGMLSAPGKNGSTSVWDWARRNYPEADGPLLVHRLDMDTSGLLLIAKTKEVHRHLQQQFETHEVKKRYVALLGGIVTEKEGFIRLPLRPDPDERPLQKVDPVNGKPAVTRYEVMGYENGRTRMAFYPQTGRTHQLRVHAAHPEGLNAPIIGDGLYGQRADRLYLHAEAIEIRHYLTGHPIRIQVPCPF